ncbi:unnamed protein product [Acanthoscelides obtectus]|uniref:Uncharacterized protein n=1 Tax=Acanthoscelides obtectus TaxID=200917 RepID=A0A9P0P1S5_ACAOB|nr:unnamed protein product [Acanthoscelides obtectus]CAH1971370.1 unnamed protein product [Acanthoscelides obtectus]CAK1631553.1 hypothetical protein AOBTE_LOCUS7004 [Acanthoscelides obtectus]CAK1680213.1 hypothetical protein AOBTE_LOCUS32534 [Acanthoscelides obtectus]
MEDGPIIPR